MADSRKADEPDDQDADETERVAEASPFQFLRDIDVEAYWKPHLTADMDLLAQHGLSGLYEAHVRPYLPVQTNMLGSPVVGPGEAPKLKLFFQKDSTGKVASVSTEKEMEPTYRDWLLDITFPPDFSPSTNLEYLAYHPNPNLPPSIPPVDDAFLRAFKLGPGKISPDEFDGSVLGVIPSEGGNPKEKRPLPPPVSQAPSGTLKLKLTRLGASTPGTPNNYVVSPAGSAQKPATQSVPAGNVAPEYLGTSGAAGTKIRLSFGKKK